MEAASEARTASISRFNLRSPAAAFVGSGLTGFAIQGSLIVSGILSARLLGVEGRGYLALLMLMPIGIAQFGGLGMPLAISFYLARDPRRERTLRRFVRRTFLVHVLLLEVVYAVIAYALLRNPSADIGTAMVASALAVPVSLGLQYTLGFLQALHDFRTFNVVRLLPTAIYGLLLVLLFVTKANTLTIIVLAWVVGSAAALAFGLRSLALRRPRDAAEARAPQFFGTMRLGLRTILGTTSPVDSFRLDQLLVGVLVSPAALGIYVVGAAFMGFPRLLAQSIGMVVFPRTAAFEKRSLAIRYAWRSAAVGAALVVSTVAAIWLFVGALVPALFGVDFAAAAEVARPLLLASVALAGRRILADAARGAGHPGLGSIAEMVSLAVLVTAALSLASIGEQGVAYAVAVSATVGLAILAVLVARLREPVKVDAPAPVILGEDA